jgi:hypothetical protein
VFELNVDRIAEHGNTAFLNRRKHNVVVRPLLIAMQGCHFSAAKRPAVAANCHWTV